METYTSLPLPPQKGWARTEHWLKKKSPPWCTKQWRRSVCKWLLSTPSQITSEQKVICIHTLHVETQGAALFLDAINPEDNVDGWMAFLHQSHLLPLPFPSGVSQWSSSIHLAITKRGAYVVSAAGTQRTATRMQMEPRGSYRELNYLRREGEGRQQPVSQGLGEGEPPQGTG